jgi:hypothetical protein
VDQEGLTPDNYHELPEMSGWRWLSGWQNSSRKGLDIEAAN